MDFTEDVILKVWQKDQIDEYNIPNNFRKDNCGAWIKRTEYEKYQLTIWMAYRQNKLRPGFS